MDEYSTLIERAKQVFPAIKAIADDTSYEEKGILYSEFLFMASCLHGIDVKRIIESGRARGQSTLLLAKTFPSAEIISFEYDEHSLDVLIANDRLKNYKNVQLLFGDSMISIPPVLRAHDVVIIDGPKGFLAIRLALKLLASKKVSHVFIHDVSIGDSCRDFLDTFLSETVYSDHKELAKITSILDKEITVYIPPANRIDGFKGEYGYGYTLGCITFVKRRPYLVLYYLSFFYDFLHSETNIWFRLNRKIKKHLSVRN